MRYSYRFKNRIIIGNRKECDFYLKYIKPIYIYPNGIKNPYSQKIKVNGNIVESDCYCNIGDYIEINDFSIRFKLDCVQSNYCSNTLLLLEYDEVQYHDFIPVVWDKKIERKTIKIEAFNEELEKTNFTQQFITTGISIIISFIMLYFIPNAIYMLLMILGNSCMILFQYILFRKNKKIKMDDYVKKRAQYDLYLLEIQRDLNHYFKNIKKYELGFSLNIYENLFSRKKKSDDYFIVDLGEKNQDLVCFQYQSQNEFIELEEMVKYYKNYRILNRISLKCKTRIQYNKHLLENLLAKLIYFHSSEEIKVKLVGNFNFSGIHFEKINVVDVIEDENLYVFDRYYKEVENLKINCIVLSDENYDFYDEVLIEKEDKVYIQSQNLDVYLDVIDFKKINQYVNKFRLKQVSKIYKNYDLFDVHKNLKWGEHDTRKEIIAYLNKECIVDFHESRDGPHALIAGMTGSGKSEWMQSLLMSMCILYSPNQINIVVIDYKGSSFASKIEGLPHVIGVIDNLNEDLNRCIEILKLEVKRRQIEFQSKGVSHIDELDLAHLFIVCDEFAELKKERSDFINELISISRIGRSLGIHLILATQRPSGIVSEEILNNANLKVALKLQDRSESMQLIGSDAAIYLKESGEFILKSNVSYYKGKSMYVNKIASLENKKRIVVNHKVLNDHTYFNYTQREYFISKMPRKDINIFKMLPTIQKRCFLLVDNLVNFEEVELKVQNIIVYGDIKVGKTTTLTTIISQIKEGVIYYIYEDSPLHYQKVISISIFDYETIKRLFYRLIYSNTEQIIVVIDHFDLLVNFDFYDKVESLIKNSAKNNITFIISMYQELNYFLQIYFSEKYVLYYDNQKRKELNQGYSFYNPKIEGRIWIKERQAQIGIGLDSYDYEIESKYDLDFKNDVWGENQYGFEFYSLNPYVIDDEVVIIYYHGKKLESYIRQLKKCNYKIININELNTYELNRIEHKIFLDEYSITIFGDFSSEINEDEVYYVGLRKKVKLKI